MKFSAVLLTACILFLSSFSGVMKSVQPAAKKMCCHKMAGKMDGKSTCPNQNKKGQNKKDCNPLNCDMMFSCSLSGFLVVERLKISPAFLTYIPKPISLYKIGDLSSYHPSDWKPPKAC